VATDLHVLRLTPYYYLPHRTLTRRELQYEPVGGMQVQIAQTSESVDAAGIRQTVVLPRRPAQPGSLPLGRRAAGRFLRLPIAPVPTRSKGYLGLLVSWGLAVAGWCLRQRLRRRPLPWDLVHVHCSELPWTYLVARWAAWVLRLPLVLTVHCSAIVTFHPETLAGWLLIGPARLAERWAVRRAEVVIVLTERTRQAYLARGLVSPSRLQVVPDGVRLALFARDPQPPPDHPTVVYCGRFAPEKGWHDFVLAAAELVHERGCDATFLMCGDGNELTRCRREVARRGLTGRVVLTGHLPREQVAATMRRARVVVVPSRHEELGGTVLEALALGRPVVTTDVGGLPELVIDGETGLLVPAGRPDQIAAAVARLWDSPRLRERLGSAGAAAVAGFDVDRVAAALCETYAAVAAGQPVPGGPRRRYDQARP
jgi:2-deoxystreptamine N-acetyl-D-glucosaminyltransferase/2-deoxystreptamine glucosyltransferase